MKRVFLLPIIWLCAVTFVACNDGYEGRDTFIKDFEKRSMEWKDTQYLSIFNDSLSQEQLESLQFLYAYMPSPDITDYSGEFHLKNVDYCNELFFSASEDFIVCSASIISFCVLFTPSVTVCNTGFSSVAVSNN